VCVGVFLSSRSSSINILFSSLSSEASSFSVREGSSCESFLSDDFKAVSVTELFVWLRDPFKEFVKVCEDDEEVKEEEEGREREGSEEEKEGGGR